MRGEDSTPKRFGELTSEEQLEQVKAACEKLGRELRSPEMARAVLAMRGDMKRLDRHCAPWSRGNVASRWVERREGVWYWHGTDERVADAVLADEGLSESR